LVTGNYGKRDLVRILIAGRFVLTTGGAAHAAL
jgi:hypothetical protein